MSHRILLSALISQRATNGQVSTYRLLKVLYYLIVCCIASVSRCLLFFSLSGKFSYHGRSLHHISNTPNPYEQAISIIGQTLSKFDEDNLIPCFGFGDGNDSVSQLTAYRTIYNFSNSHFNSTLHSSTSTHDQDVLCFYPDEKPCNGFSKALEQYRELVPHLRLAGKLLLPCPAM